MRRRWIFLMTLIVVTLAIFFISNQWRIVTYKEVMADMIGEEEVSSISITDWENNREFNSQDKAVIAPFLTGSSNMSLKKRNVNVDVDYMMYIETESGARFDLGIGKNRMTISHAGEFSIIGQNTLYPLFEHADWQSK
ncbi:hypothetical protein [Gracilibacillus salinarum]|uniref:DUF4830 domain-containing protein n=1 Tax=Gracilibacillus salinarum TaxID=2932255 RepID=A0ABY4GU94_9BACI|nr:hypothetical protein [Gracilibacillus salinarum]UOQ87242.1 hypothetical protein MUN87_10300 [Gracilibacillus salinarum]